MSDQKTVTVEREDSIAVVTINRPEKLNALSVEVVTELGAAFTALASAEVPVRAAILTGAGKAFVAGADIAQMATMTSAEARRFAELGHELGERIERATFPVIAAVNGFALGGGCELALACDFVFASEKAKFAQPEVNLAVIPGFGGTQRLSRRVGIGVARELVYTGEIIDAQRALAIGLVNRVFAADELLPAARKTAATIATKGPLAVAAAKRVMLRGEDLELGAANELEMQAFAALFGSADQREGMRAFLEKGTATFAGK